MADTKQRLRRDRVSFELPTFIRLGDIDWETRWSAHERAIQAFIDTIREARPDLFKVEHEEGPSDEGPLSTERSR